MRRLLACLLSVFPVAFAASAPEGDVQPVAGLKPMAFLAGHCWKGDFPDKKQDDEHCFQWVYAGKALRDTHTVHAPGRPGEPDPAGIDRITADLAWPPG